MQIEEILVLKEFAKEQKFRRPWENLGVRRAMYYRLILQRENTIRFYLIAITASQSIYNDFRTDRISFQEALKRAAEWRSRGNGRY